MRPVLRPLLLAVTLIALLFVSARPASADQQVHVVQPGETLFRIGLRYGVSWQSIAAANGISGTKIYAGQRLVIPDPNAPAQPAAPAVTGGTHVVQRGETLFTIGLKYGLQWTVIAQANGISGQKIYAGQTLIIPGRGATAAAPAQPPAQPAQPAQPAAPAAPPVDTTNDYKRFIVDLSEQMLYAYEGDTLVRSTLISSGLPQYPTVTGAFRIYARYKSTRMRGPGYDLPNVPYVMYFYKGYGLHGTYWHNNFGHPMSHGCVNMPTSEAEWAYNWSDYGTLVIVQY